jgi:hypothetical protein
VRSNSHSAVGSDDDSFWGRIIFSSSKGILRYNVKVKGGCTGAIVGRQAILKGFCRLGYGRSS